MAATAGGGDVWRINGEERVKHDAQFFQLKPVNGFITGEQAKGFFVQSGLLTPVLGQIWTLADVNGDGKMDKKEFSIAMHLIKKKLQGYELPKSLPSSLKADPSPVIGSFGMTPQAPVQQIGFGMSRISMMAPTSVTMGSPVMANGVVSGSGIAQPGFGGIPMTAAMVIDNKARTFSTPPPAPAPGVTVGFAMPHHSKLKYTQLFNVNDRNKRGFLSGVEARAILMQSALSQPILAQIWVLSDIDNDGKLTCDEFCIAMHLVDFVRSGKTLPQKLPSELLPTKPRSGSIQGQAITPPLRSTPSPATDAFGDLLGGMVIGTSTPEPAANGEEIPFEDPSPVTFEDKRQENFLRGQAELDRRRQMLQEQLKAEENARLEKERREYEKIEQARQEQERKRQLELEKHLEKQRQIEREREEQRQNMMKQREAAKRELDRQRQMDWEQQRKKELLSEKGREYETLGMLKSKESNFKCELESIGGKKNEINQKITQVRNGVTDFTSSIELMRVSRDTKLGDIEKLQHELQELSQKYLKLQQDRDQLNVCVQTTLQSNPLSDTHRTIMHSVELKKTTVQRLKKELEQVERETEAKLNEIDSHNATNNELNNKINMLQKDLSQMQNRKNGDVTQQMKKDSHREKQEKLRKELEEQRKREENVKKTHGKSTPPKPQNKIESSWFAFGGDNCRTTTTSDDPWASAFTSRTTAQSSSPSCAWGDAVSSQPIAKQIPAVKGPKKKYHAVYQFDARNPDELSLKIGDIIMVPDDQKGAEPGWLGGEKDGKSGWFPADFVEKESSSQNMGFSFSVPDSSIVPQPNDNQQSTAIFNSSEESPFTPIPANPPTVSPTPGQGETAPDGLQAQALYPWKAKKENHLTFNKGDIIAIKEQQEMWWSGDLCGKTGWFPKSYVKIVGGPAVNSSKSSSRSGTPVGTSDGTDIARSFPTLDKREIGGIVNKEYGSTFQQCIKYHVAMYSYVSGEATDLTFNQGDVILVSKTEGDWWTGSIGDKSGVFPANYVKKMEVQAEQFGVGVIDDTLKMSASSAVSGEGGKKSVTQQLEAPPLSSGNVLGGGGTTTNFTNTHKFNSQLLCDSITDESAAGFGIHATWSTTATETTMVSSADNNFDTFSGMFNNSGADVSKQENQYLSHEGGDDLLAGQTSSNLCDNDFLTTADVFSSSTSSTSEHVDFYKESVLDTPEVFDSFMESRPIEAKPDLLSNTRSTLEQQRSLLDFDNAPHSRRERRTPEKIKPAPGLPSGPDLPGQKILKKPEIASVIAAYTATGQEQLSLQPGQLIHVRKKSPSGWWEGELQARGQKRKIGWFPANYVKLLGSSARNTPESTGQAATMGTLVGTLSATSVPAKTLTPVTSQSSTPIPAVQSVKYVDHLVALYPYIAQREDELTFPKDVVINVISKDDASWWQGECNGRTGMFPSNYVGPLSSSSTQEHSCETSLSEASRGYQMSDPLHTQIQYSQLNTELVPN